MIVLPTEKLYFNKFIYSIKFKMPLDRNACPNNVPLIKQIKKHLKNNGMEYQTRLDWKFKDKTVEVTLSAYLNDKTTYDELLIKYPTIISKTNKPINDKHKDMLQDKIEVIVRNKLLYNKFKYKVILGTGFSQEYSNEIRTWISTTFEGRTEGQTGDFLVKGRWMISLYLTNKEDLMQVRLCLGDYIKNIIRVEAFEDHKV